MRGLKAILTAAGDLKRKFDYDEDILILIASADDFSCIQNVQFDSWIYCSSRALDCRKSVTK